MKQAAENAGDLSAEQLPAKSSTEEPKSSTEELKSSTEELKSSTEPIHGVKSSTDLSQAVQGVQALER